MTIVARQHITIVNHLDCIASFGLEPGIEEGNVGLSNAKSGPGRVQGLGESDLCHGAMRGTIQGRGPGGRIMLIVCFEWPSESCLQRA